MKKLLIMLMVITGAAVGNAGSSRSYASSVYKPHTSAFVCVPDGRGGMCCWETTVEGPFRPVSC
jgi:hypothetical protein